VERGSDKHGPRVDEEMEREVESIQKGAPVPSRVEPHREVEPVDEDDEPTSEDDLGEVEEEEQGRS